MLRVEVGVRATVRNVKDAIIALSLILTLTSTLSLTRIDSEEVF